MHTIADIMTRHVITVGMDDEVSLMETLLETRGIKHLPVVDEENKLVGIISDRDLRDALSPYVHTAAATSRDEALLHRHAHLLMSRHPVTAAPEDEIDYVARLMLFNDVSAIPIVESDGHLVGIASWEDLLCHYTRSAATTP